MSTKYTKELLAAAVEASVSMAGVLRYLGVKQTGGSQAHLTRMVKKYEISTEHFTGKRHNAGKPSPRRLNPDEVLVVLPENSARPKAKPLRNAMVAKGLTERCFCCKLVEWLGERIVLDIDHINGNWLDNRIENLRFLCPNCHRQTDTFGNLARVV